MDKLKNIGITALAGTLVSLSAAQAGGVSVSGSWELSYTELDHDEVAGQKLGMNKNITFGGSGDVTSGGGVTWASTVAMSDSMGLSSASLAINMGGIATLAYDSGTGGYGANAVDNIVPTAWEEIDAGFSTGISDVGAISKSKGVVNLTIKAPGSGTAVSLSYISRMGQDHVSDGATGGNAGNDRGMDLTLDLLNVNQKWFGFRLGAAAEIQFKDETCDSLVDATGNGPTHSCAPQGGGIAPFQDDPYAATAYTSLKIGPFSAGFQGTYKEPHGTATTSVANNQSWVAGAAFTIGNYASVSYGKGIDRYQYNNADRSEGEVNRSHFEGYSASLNAGPVALKYFTNTVDNVNGAMFDADQHSEINLSIAF